MLVQTIPIAIARQPAVALQCAHRKSAKKKCCKSRPRCKNCPYRKEK